ncbi:hypothetical protein [Clostridium cellulovorans]|uniref:Amidase domain-containing protein n=1 Tax=Clostridium cellulovorans (strain ATCC 35296 / DSM 3052 / OCM 3 / 743B) TaxID=573061 RepID=D9SM80_CLOC7|nr:hypothetical protein [Clostridium cellulovorans]ADL53736.1 hypothetical protein Clocel_4074 [Clostridium cellulovorans 743B]
MNIRKRLLSFISASALVFVTIAGVSVSATGANEVTINTAIGYNYPIKPGTVEWYKLGNKPAREKSCQIPEEVLKSLTTDELIETVLNYPFLMDIYAYDSYQKGFNAVSKKFNGLKELLKREDVADKLIAKYKSIEVADDVASSEIFDLASVEVLLRQDEVISKLNDTSKNEVEKEVENKYMQKKEHKDIYGATCATSYKVEAEKQATLSTEQSNTLATTLIVKPAPALSTTLVVDQTTTLATEETPSLVAEQTTKYVYTPKGTPVEVLQLGELMTNAEKVEADNWVKSTYPGIGLLRSATSNYNCHSYAWYSQATSNVYWINNPTPYMTDGSYNYMGTASGYSGERVYYSSPGNEHSGIVYNRIAGTIGPDAYGNVNVLSKWGTYGLVRHSAQNCPYYVGGLALQFYKKN